MGDFLTICFLYFPWVSTDFPLIFGDFPARTRFPPAFSMSSGPVPAQFRSGSAELMISHLSWGKNINMGLVPVDWDKSGIQIIEIDLESDS